MKILWPLWTLFTTFIRNKVNRTCLVLHRSLRQIEIFNVAKERRISQMVDLICLKLFTYDFKLGIFILNFDLTYQVYASMSRSPYIACLWDVKFIYRNDVIYISQVLWPLVRFPLRWPFQDLLSQGPFFPVRRIFWHFAHCFFVLNFSLSAQKQHSWYWETPQTAVKCTIEW